MSGSDRSRHVAAGLAITAILAVCSGSGAYYFGLGQIAGHSQAKTQHYQTEYAESTSQRITRCFNKVAAPRACVEKAIRDNYDHQRDESDLRAQREMAEWAFWMLIISGVSLGVTSIGTAFLAWQVQLTREAVKETGDATKAMLRQNDLTEAAQRAKIIVTLRLIHSPNSDEFAVLVEATNIGMSIAYIDKVDLSWRKDEFPFQSETYRHHILGLMLKSGETEKIWETRNRMVRLKDGRYFGGTVFYRSPFSRDHKTYFANEYVGILVNDTRLFVAMGHVRDKWPDDT